MLRFFPYRRRSTRARSVWRGATGPHLSEMGSVIRDPVLFCIVMFCIQQGSASPLLRQKGYDRVDQSVGSSLLVTSDRIFVALVDITTMWLHAKVTLVVSFKRRNLSSVSVTTFLLDAARRAKVESRPSERAKTCIKELLRQQIKNVGARIYCRFLDWRRESFRSLAPVHSIFSLLSTRLRAWKTWHTSPSSKIRRNIHSTCGDMYHMVDLCSSRFGLSCSSC